MSKKTSINRLKLSLCPISNYDLVCLKECGVNLKERLANTRIYILAQRPVLTFDNLRIISRRNKAPLLKFEITQKGNKKRLKCSLPFHQKAFGNLEHERIGIVPSFAPSENKPQRNFPLDNLLSFTIFGEEEVIGNWFSPETFLHGYWNDDIKVSIKGNIQNFLRYNVLYVGKAIDEHVLDRMNGHERLQDILSVESPFQFGSLPTDEITILFFEFSDNLYTQFFFPEDEITEEFFNHMIAGTLPTIPQKSIYSDCEKALIHALLPKHNRIYYNKYPKVKDSLLEHSVDAFTYSFSDPIKLVYADGQIKGSQHFDKADTLLIDNPNELFIVKNDNFFYKLLSSQ